MSCRRFIFPCSKSWTNFAMILSMACPPVHKPAPGFDRASRAGRSVYNPRRPQYNPRRQRGGPLLRSADEAKSLRAQVTRPRGDMNRKKKWQMVLDAEVQRWSAMSCEDLVSKLHELQAYEVEFDSNAYQVEGELL